MTEALSPPVTAPSPTLAHHIQPPTASPTSATTPDTSESCRSLSPKATPREPRPQARERIPSYAQNRMSAYSQRSSRSRPQSHGHSTPPLGALGFPSPGGGGGGGASLGVGGAGGSHTFVRDFAYPSYHPMHYGPPPESASGASTPGSSMDWNPGRRASDSAETLLVNGHYQPHYFAQGGGAWTAGPWGGDGGAALYSEAEQMDAHPHSDRGDPHREMESLPSTSFAGASESMNEPVGRYGRGSGGRHRKSKSYASISDFERGRRRESGGHGAGDRGRDTADIFYFTGHGGSNGVGQPHSDPAGRESLRQSRGYYPDASAAAATVTASPAPVENGSRRRDSRYNDATLPSRSFHTASASTSSQRTPETESDLPLDAEYSSNHHHYSPQRESLGPEDEELFAGPSLALYNFEPENPNELRLVEGQIILVSYRHGQGWLVAEDPQTGEQGLVPEEYVRLLRDIEGWDAERGRFIEDDEDEDGEEEEDAEEDDSLVADATQQMEDSDPVNRLAHHAEGLAVQH